MRHVLGGIGAISEWTGKVISVLILLMVIILLCEITLRYGFNAPTIWAHEIILNMFGALSVLAGGYVLLHFQHVKVDILYTRLPPRGKAIANSVTYLLFFLFIGVMLLYGWQIAWHSVKIMEFSNTPWAPPLYPLKLTVPIAAFLILIQGLAHFIRDFSMAITGRELI